MQSDDYCDYCKHKEKCGSLRSCVFKGIEVEPVRHGYWIVEDRYHCQCSVCKKIVVRESTSYEYCPRCIAKMDGDNS